MQKKFIDIICSSNLHFEAFAHAPQFHNVSEQLNYWKQVVSLLESFYNENLGKISIFSSFVNVHLICLEYSETELCKIVQLMFAASACSEDANSNILLLPIDDQNQLMMLTQQILQRWCTEPSNDLKSPIKIQTPTTNRFALKKVASPETPIRAKRLLLEELNQTVEASREEMQKENANLKQQLSTIHTENALMKRELEILKEEHDSLNKKISLDIDDRIFMQEDAMLHDDVISIVATPRSSFTSPKLVRPVLSPASPKGARQKLVSALEEKDQEIKALNKRFGELLPYVKENQELKDELDLIRSKLVESEQARIVAEKYKTKLESNNHLKKQKNELEQKLDTYLERNIKLEDEVLHLKMHNSSLQLYKEQVFVLKEEKELMDQTLNSNAEVIEEYQSKTEMLQEYIANLKRELTHRPLFAHVPATVEQHREDSEQLIETRKELSIAQKMASHLQEQVKILNQEREQLLERVNQNSSVLIAKHESKIQEQLFFENQEELENLKSLVKQITAEKQDTTELQLLQQENTHLQTQVLELGNTVRVLKHQLENSKRKITVAAPSIDINVDDLAIVKILRNQIKDKENMEMFLKDKLASLQNAYESQLATLQNQVRSQQGAIMATPQKQLSVRPVPSPKPLKGLSNRAVLRPVKLNK